MPKWRRISSGEMTPLFAVRGTRALHDLQERGIRFLFMVTTTPSCSECGVSDLLCRFLDSLGRVQGLGCDVGAIGPTDRATFEEEPLLRKEPHISCYSSGPIRSERLARLHSGPIRLKFATALRGPTRQRLFRTHIG